MMPMQPGDVKQTYANVSALKSDFNYQPITEVGEGIANFVAWYKAFYSIENREKRVTNIEYRTTNYE